MFIKNKKILLGSLGAIAGSILTAGSILPVILYRQRKDNSHIKHLELNSLEMNAINETYLVDKSQEISVAVAKQINMKLNNNSTFDLNKYEVYFDLNNHTLILQFDSNKSTKNNVQSSVVVTIDTLNNLKKKPSILKLAYFELGHIKSNIVKQMSSDNKVIYADKNKNIDLSKNKNLFQKISDINKAIKNENILEKIHNQNLIEKVKWQDILAVIKSKIPYKISSVNASLFWQAIVNKPKFNMSLNLGNKTINAILSIDLQNSKFSNKDKSINICYGLEINGSKRMGNHHLIKGFFKQQTNQEIANGIKSTLENIKIKTYKEVISNSTPSTLNLADLNDIIINVKSKMGEVTGKIPEFSHTANKSSSIKYTLVGGKIPNTENQNPTIAKLLFTVIVNDSNASDYKKGPKKSTGEIKIKIINKAIETLEIFRDKLPKKLISTLSIDTTDNYFKTISLSIWSQLGFNGPFPFGDYIVKYKTDGIYDGENKKMTIKISDGSFDITFDMPVSVNNI